MTDLFDGGNHPISFSPQNHTCVTYIDVYDWLIFQPPPLLELCTTTTQHCTGYRALSDNQRSFQAVVSLNFGGGKPGVGYLLDHYTATVPLWSMLSFLFFYYKVFEGKLVTSCKEYFFLLVQEWHEQWNLQSLFYKPFAENFYFYFYFHISILTYRLQA